MMPEGISVEFKSSSTEISSTTYETVCAFLNRSGGHVILGVNDSGKIIGVQDKLLEANRLFIQLETECSDIVSARSLAF
jgi:predicted HTH transcriptional regulator